MKRNELRTLLCAGVVLLVALPATMSEAAETNAAPAVQFTDDQLGEKLQAAVLLARVGLYDEAAAQCEQILAQKPNESTVKQLLEEIQAKRRERNPSGSLRHKLDEIIIPEVNVHDASVIDVVEFLRGQSQTLSRDKTAINFVWQAPEDAKAAKVTLNLRNIPLADVLKYVMDSTGLRYRVDAHAIVIYKPLPTAPKDSTPSNAKP
jgi:hypothetical protein